MSDSCDFEAAQRVAKLFAEGSTPAKLLALNQPQMVGIDFENWGRCTLQLFEENEALRKQLKENERLWSCAQAVLFGDDCPEGYCEEPDCIPCRAMDELKADHNKMHPMGTVSTGEVK